MPRIIMLSFVKFKFLVSHCPFRGVYGNLLKLHSSIVRSLLKEGLICGTGHGLNQDVRVFVSSFLCKHIACSMGQGTLVRRFWCRLLNMVELVWELLD